MVHKFVCDQDLALTVRIRDLNRRFGGLQPSLPVAGFSGLDSGLHVADSDAATEAPAARDSSDVDGAAPLVTAEGNLGRKPGCRMLWSG